MKQILFTHGLRVTCILTLFCSLLAQSQDKPLCSTFTDRVCSELWDADHRGNLKTSDGEIIFGKSEKSNMVALATLEDNYALLKAQARLPSDLKLRAQKLLLKMKAMLAHESETIKWVREYNRWDQEWDQLISDIAQERAIKKFPVLKKTRLSERTQAENSLINREYYKLLDEVTIAKYANHPNWKRVEHSFEEIRGHLIEEIKLFPYSDEFKQFLIKRVKAVELSLPLLDIDVFDGRKECSISTINAYYLPSYNKLTVCTGMFNGLKSESSIYIILAHELSHSIDPGSVNYAWLKEVGIRTQALMPLVGIHGKPLACKDWETIVAKLNAAKIDRVLQTKPYDSLALCLDNGQLLKKAFDPSEITRQVDEDMVETMDYLANRNLFSYMVIPNYTEFGKTKQNPYYLKPEVFLSEYTGKGYATSHQAMRNYPYSPEIFYQVVQCEVEKQAAPQPMTRFFTKDGFENKEKILKASIDQTKDLLAKLYEEVYFNCGQYCSAFVRKGMARNVEEKFADWMSFRIFSRFLKTQKSLEERRRISGLALANLCDRPSVRQEAGSLLTVEKQYSIESHAESRVRRLGLYNKEISELLECIPETQDAWGSCTP